MNDVELLKANKSLGIQHNVSFRVLDAGTHEVLREYVGHNVATNTMLVGIAHYLTGDTVLNQGQYMLDTFVPQYISLGTMGLKNQQQDANGLPKGVTNYQDYYNRRPGYGADGYDSARNRGRDTFGLGIPFTNYSVLQRYRKNDEVSYKGKVYKCTANELAPGDWNSSYWQEQGTLTEMELISPSFPRAEISYREIVPETESELPNTVDVILSALISTGALRQFREFYGNDYIFISEAGLWSRKSYNNSGSNGLLAGYRIIPPNPSDRTLAGLKKHILRVGINEVVQVIWKIQLGSIGDIGQLQNVSIPVKCITTGRTYSSLLAVQGTENIPWEEVLQAIESGEPVRGLEFVWA